MAHMRGPNDRDRRSDPGRRPGPARSHRDVSGRPARRGGDPIGDITARALDTLRTAALIACEDTRTTGKLLHRFGIDTKMAPYHEHNAEWARPKILETLRAGRTVALVSDAGTPLVSDPGYRLVQACLEEGVRVTVAPGPSAPVAALVLSGLPSASFYFGGFLPNKSAARRKAPEAVRAVPSTLIFFGSPNRLAASLADAAEVLGERDVAVARRSRSSTRRSGAVPSARSRPIMPLPEHPRARSFLSSPRRPPRERLGRKTISTPASVTSWGR